VLWVRARDSAGRVSALPNQVPGLADHYGLTRADVDRAVWSVDAEGRMLSGAAATNAVLAELGGLWRLLAAAGRLPVISWLEERAYRWIAAHRSWLSELWSTIPECERPGGRCN
jgi:predicted DCC family thiol-disulfide oxidoreductase YuxK